MASGPTEGAGHRRVTRTRLLFLVWGNFFNVHERAFEILENGPAARRRRHWEQLTARAQLSGMTLLPRGVQCRSMRERRNAARKQRRK
jgi:hypothetical protein